jgi:hypothetical protein
MSAKAEIVPIEQSDKISPMSLLQLAVDRGASIDTIERLAKLQREMQELDAKMAYGQAMKRAQEVIPRIATDLTNPETHSKYASYAALDRVIRPVYTREGFSLSFNTGESPQADHVRVYCTVRHTGGHSELFQIDMPTDGKGPKGAAVMTRTHATGAGASYGMRYLLKMIFNVAIGEDDRDGNNVTLDEALVVERLDWIDSCSTLVELQRIFTEAYKMADHAKDRNAAGLFVRAKDKKKKELQQEGGAR